MEKGVRKEGRVLALKWQRLLTQKCLGDQAHLVRGLHTYRRNNPVSVTSDTETITEMGGVAVANRSSPCSDLAGGSQSVVPGPAPGWPGHW